MASRETIENLATSEKFAQVVKTLYGEDKFDYQLKRYRELYYLHCKKHGDGGVFYSSPGRIEVCGNHTDHNNGKVLCASINVDTLACVTPRIDNKIIIESAGFSPIHLSATDVLSKKDEEGKAVALVRGILAYFKMNNFRVGGFAATTTSDVFKGAGVSSSASFEMLICEILNQTFNYGYVDVLTRIKAGHFAESEYFAKPCGLLDQSAIALGGVSYIDFKSSKTPIFRTLEWKFENLKVVLINTGGDHSDLTDQYASIRTDMETIAKHLGARKLRNVNELDFYGSLPILQRKVSGRALLRAMHFYDENKRVHSCTCAIRSNNERRFANAINASGESSYTMLQNCYPEGDIQQRIPFAIKLSKKMEGVKAARVHGGGFAGTVIAYVEKRYCDNYVKSMKKLFGADNVYVVDVRQVGTTKVSLNPTGVNN